MNIIEKINEVLYDLDCADNMSEEYKKLDSIREYLQHCGALVPVPDGPEMTAFRTDGNDLFLQLDGRVYDHRGGFSYRDVSTRDMKRIEDDTIVQPVRLVPITEAEI